MMLLQIVIVGSGGLAKKVMSGKLGLPIEIGEMDVRTVQVDMLAKTTVCKLLTLH